jgi:hypothetical protein
VQLGLLIGADHGVVGSELDAVPDPLVEVQHPDGLGGEVGARDTSRRAGASHAKAFDLGDYPGEKRPRPPRPRTIGQSCEKLLTERPAGHDIDIHAHSPGDVDVGPPLRRQQLDPRLRRPVRQSRLFAVGFRSVCSDNHANDSASAEDDSQRARRLQAGSCTS